MKLSIITVYVYMFIAGVLGNKYSGPFESVFLWYAYRMDFMAYGPNEYHITRGSDVTATGPHGSFKFDEFLNAIRKVGVNTPPWTGSTGVGDNLTPEVDDAVKRILATRDTGTATDEYRNEKDLFKLYPGLQLDEGEKQSYKTMFKRVFQSIQRSRQEVANNGGPATGFTQDDFDTALSRARDATVGMHGGRLADMGKTQIRRVNEELSRQGVGFEVETKIESYGTLDLTWEAVDTEATVQAHPDDGDKIKAAVQGFAANTLGKNKQIKELEKHRAALMFSQTLTTRMTGSSDLEECI